jgi:hypothetical protein
VFFLSPFPSICFPYCSVSSLLERVEESEREREGGRDGEIMEDGEMQQQPAGEISKGRMKGIWGGIQGCV